MRQSAVGPTGKRSLSDISPSSTRATAGQRTTPSRPALAPKMTDKPMISAEEFGMPKMKPAKSKVAGGKPPFWLFVLLFVVLPALAAGAAYYIYYIRN